MNRVEMRVFSLAIGLSLLAIVLAAMDRIPSKVETTFGASAIMQQSYELRCRGGGLKFNSAPGRALPVMSEVNKMTPGKRFLPTWQTP
jgi:hypothetical protein